MILRLQLYVWDVGRQSRSEGTFLGGRYNSNKLQLFHTPSWIIVLLRLLVFEHLANGSFFISPRIGRGGAVGWGTALHARRKRGRLSYEQKWVPGISPGGGKAAGVLGEPFHLHVPSRNFGSLNQLPAACPGLYSDCFTFSGTYTLWEKPALFPLFFFLMEYLTNETPA
jgi:hypothetical protein